MRIGSGLVIACVLGGVLWTLLGEGEEGAGEAAVVAPVDVPKESPIEAELATPEARRPAAPVPVEARPDEPPEVAESVPPGDGLPLAGRVVMVDGRGLPMVDVHAPALDLRALTSASGEFRIEGLEPGEVELEVGSSRSGTGDGYEIVGRRTFRAGDEAVELVVRACLLRVRAADESGAPVAFNSVEVTDVGDDGYLSSILSWSSGGGAQFADLPVPVDRNLRARVQGAAGSFAGLVHTPVAGGAVEVVLEVDSPSMATLELALGGPLDRVIGARLDVSLVNLDRDDRIDQSDALSERILIPGLTTGLHTLEVSVAQPQGTRQSQIFALVGAPAEIEVTGTGRIPIALELVPGGELELVLSADLDLLPREMLPVVVQVEVRPEGRSEALDLRWTGWHGGGAVSRPTIGGGWVADRSLPPGRYDVRVQAEGFRPSQTTASVVGGQACKVAIELLRE
ncbi:carboxypeptidase regulatory-like domain-containing protein [Engelhardtia mirabilis]